MGVPDVGVMLPTMTAGEPLADIAAAARWAEELGYESGWVVDQLVAGSGVPFLDSTVALAVAAGVTARLRLGFGVMVLPLRTPVWAAKQVGSLQVASGGRVLLGVGVGGDRHERSWAAAGVARAERGRRTDAALAVLAPLLRGEPTLVDTTEVQLSPGVEVPPILVGGATDVALRRVVEHGDGWFALPLPPAALAPSIDRLGELAAAAGRDRPSVTAGVSIVLDGDPDAPDADGLRRLLTDPDGMYAMPPEAASTMVVTGGPEALAERVDGLAALGVERVVVTPVAGGWSRQAELASAALGLATGQGRSPGWGLVDQAGR